MRLMPSFPAWGWEGGEAGEEWWAGRRCSVQSRLQGGLYLLKKKKITHGAQAKMTRKSQISESFKNRNVPGKPWWSPTLSCHPCDPPAEKPELEVKAQITEGKTGLAYFSAPAGTARPRRDLHGEGHGLRHPTAGVRVLALGLQLRRPQLPDVSEAVFLSVKGVTRSHRRVLGKISGGVFTKCVALSEVQRKRLITERWLLSGGPHRTSRKSTGDAGSSVNRDNAGCRSVAGCGSVQGLPLQSYFVGFWLGVQRVRDPAVFSAPASVGGLTKAQLGPVPSCGGSKKNCWQRASPRACPPRAPGRQRGRRRGWG